jgi:hypothetical protein
MWGSARGPDFHKAVSMGLGVRTFLVDENDRVVRVPVKVLSGEPRKAVPEYAGKRVRYALVVVVHRHRKPLYVDHMECGYVAFDRMGRLDRGREAKEMAAAIRCIDDPYAGKGLDNIIDAAVHFAKRQYQHECKWKPTPKIVHEIKKLVFKGMAGYRK